MSRSNADRWEDEPVIPFKNKPKTDEQRAAELNAIRLKAANVAK